MDSTQPRTYDQIMQDGQAAYDGLALEEARACYQAAQALRPQSYEAALGLARTQVRTREPEDAYAAAERCVQLDAHRAEAYATMGVLHFLTDRLDEAVSVLQQAAELAPADPEPHITLAQVYADQKRYADAEEELHRARVLADAMPAAQHDAMVALVWHAETYIYLARGRARQARECVQQVLALEDANPYAACLAYSNMGIIEAHERHYDRAIEYLERAFSKNRYLYRAGVVLGRLLMLRGQHQRAVEVLEQALRVTPSGIGPYRYSYASALAKTGRRAEALAQYRQARLEGLTGPMRWLVHWHILWLNPAGRYALIGVVLAALMVWLLLSRPSPQVLTFLLVLVVIVVLQRTLGRRRH